MTLGSGPDVFRPFAAQYSVFVASGMSPSFVPWQIHSISDVENDRGTQSAGGIKYAQEHCCNDREAVLMANSLSLDGRKQTVFVPYLVKQLIWGVEF